MPRTRYVIIFKMMNQNQKRTEYLYALLIGFLSFSILFGVRSLNFTDDSWILSGYVDRDIVQHYTGWLFYRNEPLRFPFGFVQSINYPKGASILFCDSIPLVALIFRILNPILPSTFQYFGLWICFCYLMQGLFAYRLSKQLFQDKIHCYFSTILFVFAPILIERSFRHSSLCAHFLILWAIALYFQKEKSSLWEALLVSFLAGGIHTYFIPMVLAIFFSLHMDLAIRSKQWLRHICSIILCVLSSLFALFIFGFFTQTTRWSHLGYGLFVMNFNSLFNPISANDVHWSMVLPTWDVFLIYENFLYLGLGILVLLFFVFVLEAKNKFLSIRKVVRQYPVLTIVCIALTLFAISNYPTINDSRYHLFDLPSKLVPFFDMIRSSSRMFWPVYYLTILYLLRALFTLPSKKLVTIGMLLLLILQLGDMAPTIFFKNKDFQSGSNHFDNPIDNSFFEENKDSFDHIQTIGNHETFRGLYLAYWAAKNHMTVNDPFSAAANIDDLVESSQQQIALIKEGQLDSRTLYVFVDKETLDSCYPYLSNIATIAQLSEYYVAIPNTSNVKLPEECTDEGANRFIVYK